MKTKLFILLAALSFSSATLIAQEKTMYVMKNGEVAYQSAVLDVDSIIFYKPSTSTIPEGGVLINGVVWASCNVDAPGTFAATPESPGMFYQWNRKKAWSATEPGEGIAIGADGGWDSSTPTGTTWEKANDPSPSGWRVPTTEEQQSLLDESKVKNEWVTQNGVTGRKFTDLSNESNFIFLPAVGYRYDNDGTLYDAGSYGGCWSSTQVGSYGAYSMNFYSGDAYWGSNFDRNYGFSVRPVAEN